MDNTDQENNDPEMDEIIDRIDEMSLKTCIHSTPHAKHMLNLERDNYSEIQDILNKLFECTKKIKYLEDSIEEVLDNDETGFVHRKKYFNLDMECHRENGPAEIVYFTDNRIMEENWYLNGLLHRDNGAAVIKYRKNDILKSKVYLKHGVTHNVEGPAVIRYKKDGSFESFEFYVNGINVTETVNSGIHHLDLTGDTEEWLENHRLYFKLILHGIDGIEND